MYHQRKPVKCADGFEMSVQAGSFHYSTPRVDNCGWYTHYEVGFPSERENWLLPWIERGEDDPTKTVYPWVPVEIVMAVIARHGGLA